MEAAIEASAISVEPDRAEKSMRCDRKIFGPCSCWHLTALSGRVVMGDMLKTSLLHGLFPVVRAEVLRLLFTNPRQELYVRELARLSFLSLQTVQDELAKLESAGLISSRSNGYQRFYRANPKHPLYAAVRRIVIHAALQPKPRPPARGTRSRKHRAAVGARK